MPGVHRSPLLLLAALSLACLVPRAGRAGTAPADSALAYPPPGVRAWQVGVPRADRLQHASLSFTIAAGATLVSREPLASFAGTLALGLAKEIWDSRRGSFDSADLAAGAVGAALGASAAGARR